MPEQEENSKNWIVRLFRLMNSNWSSRIFSIVVLGIIVFAGFIYFTRQTITKPQDCSRCEADKKVLVDVLVDLKNDMTKLAQPNDHANSIHFNSGEALLFPYSLDTVPKRAAKKRITPNVQQQQQQQIVLKDLKKIDSILQKIQSQQQQKHN